VFATTLLPDPVAVCVLGGGAALLGLTALVAGPALRRPRGRRTFGLALLVLAVVAAVAPLLGPAQKLWLPPLLPAAVGGLAWLLSAWPSGRSLCAGLAALAVRPGVQAVALLAGGPLLLAGWAWHAENWLLTSGRAGGQGRYGPALEGGQPEMLTLWTDQGGTIPVTRIPAAGRSVEAAAEAHLVHSEGLELRLLRTGAASWGSNCHGWVFTAGQYLLAGEAVDPILRDNGYQPVATPRPGDLVVYRAGHSGSVAHTGVVRLADPDLLLVESKWNELGVYLHRPEDYHPRLGLTCEYYRSPRRGHLLHGLDPASPSETAPGLTEPLHKLSH
jgi:hypothetical protein